jgi:predicted nucleotidyltransferase
MDDLPLLHKELVDMENLLLAEKGFPDDIVRDLETIKSILLRHGAWKIIVYGSIARGDYRADSDIDICCEGIPPEHYFRALAECLMATQRRVSVLDFAGLQGYFKERILREGKILYEHDRAAEGDRVRA